MLSTIFIIVSASILTILLGYLLLALFLYIKQENLIFPGNVIEKNTVLELIQPKNNNPFKTHEEFLELNTEYKQLQLKSIIHIVYSQCLLSKENLKNKTIIYFHGNAENIKETQFLIPIFNKKGYDVVLIDYPNYGKSEGQIKDEKHIFSILEKTFSHILDELHLKEEDVILFGRSIGTGLACFVAQHKKIYELWLHNPYDSLVNVVKNKYPYIPVGVLLKFPILAFKYIQQVTCPIKMLVGELDKTTPLTGAEKLFKIAQEHNAHVEMVVVKNGEHNNLFFTKEFKELFDLKMITHENNQVASENSKELNALNLTNLTVENRVADEMNNNQKVSAFNLTQHSNLNVVKANLMDKEK